MFSTVTPDLKRYIIYRGKAPCSPVTGYPVSVTDDAHWVTYSDAVQAKTIWNADGVGFVIAPPHWFLDIDHCLNDGKWSNLAIQLLTRFQGAAIEVSQSKRGLHIFGTGIAPAHRCKNKELGIEFYTENRYAALTGIHAAGSIDFDASAILPDFIAEYFLPDAKKEISHGSRVLLNDDELLDLMLKSKSNPFKRSASFKDLWDANEAALASTYPIETDRADGLHYDASSADAALAQHLAFWTGNDMPRIERLMLSSALVRNKWSSRADYLIRTIQRACEKQTVFYQPPVNAAPPPSHSVASSSQNNLSLATPTAGSRLLSIADQIQLFEGCVYILDEHRALIPGGYVINAERFKVFYGGYSFVMDKENSRVSRNAWEAFTENQGFTCPRVVNTCFRPLLSPGEIVEEDGARLVNTWWPIQTPRKSGNASRFVAHLAKLLPDAEERVRVLAYLAALVQYQGVKFEWCLVLQGVEGNGKTLITRCLARAIGNRYTHFPKADQIGTKFNDWMENRIFIAVEDLDAEATEHLMEVFKRLVTHERQEIEPKGGKKVTRDVCCNYIINTNHRNALRKSRDDRRLGIFYTAQQEKDDLARDDMTTEYFQSLYIWLKTEGYAIVHDFLATYPIPDAYNPALKHIAPVTKSTKLAIEESASAVEQEIQEAISQEISGFKAGWVSSVALAQLLERLKMHLTPKKRFMLLGQMGYILHPALPAGRVNNIVLPDGAKPKLFVHHSSPALLLSSPAEIARAYSDAQAVS